MSEETSRVAGMPEFLAAAVDEARRRMDEAAAERRRQEADPAWRARQEAERVRRRAERAVERRDGLRARADERGVPAEAELRVVAVDDDAPVTDALRSYREALAWRKAHASDVGTVPLVRLVSGPCGTGKSCAMAHVVVRARAAQWVTASRLAATPRNGWSTNEALWDRWLAVEILAVDDVGTEPGDRSVIPFLMTERWNAGLVTLMTSNLALADWHERYKADDRLTSRIREAQQRNGGEGGLRWFVTVAGASLRNPAARAAAVAQRDLFDGAGLQERESDE